MNSYKHVINLHFKYCLSESKLDRKLPNHVFFIPLECKVIWTSRMIEVDLWAVNLKIVGRKGRVRNKKALNFLLFRWLGNA